MKSNFPIIVAVVLASSACAAARAPASPGPCAGLDIDACAAKYEQELTLCSVQADTRDQSELCEDSVRLSYGREPRPSKATRDGGAL